MIQRIIEAFTRPYCSTTMVDGLIIFLVLLPILIVVSYFMSKIERF